MNNNVPERITEAQLSAVSATFELLSTPVRLQLVWILATGEQDVSSLAEKSSASIASTSQHLAKLRAAGVVIARREGRRQYYRIENPHISAIVGQMFSYIASDGTIATELDSLRPPRRPRFDVGYSRK